MDIGTHNTEDPIVAELWTRIDTIGLCRYSA